MRWCEHGHGRKKERNRTGARKVRRSRRMWKGVTCLLDNGWRARMKKRYEKVHRRHGWGGEESCGDITVEGWGV